MSILAWAVAFLATTISAFFGGTYHGLHEVLGEQIAATVWAVVVYSLGIMSAAMLVGSIKAVVSHRLHRPQMSLVVLKFLIYAVWMLSHDEFLYMVADYVPSMLLVLGLHLADAIKNGKTEGYWMVAGIGASLFGAVLQQAGVSFHTHFNHNDLLHLVQLIGMICLYHGIVHLEDRPPIAKS